MGYPYKLKLILMQLGAMITFFVPDTTALIF